MKPDRWVQASQNREFRKETDNEDGFSQNFTMKELKASIEKTNPTKAAEADGMHPK